MSTIEEVTTTTSGANSESTKTPHHRRKAGRATDHLRPVTVKYNPFGYGASSVMLRAGETVVYVAVSLVPGVPQFLKGKGTGWLSAEYEMLPTATRKRSQRESTQQQRNARSIEISRLIGRVFRSVLDLKKIGEFTIQIDCEVLQADGGTRTAAVTAASLALKRACDRWHSEGRMLDFSLQERIVGISAGVAANDTILLDLDQDEDNVIDADFNFILTESGKVIEIQGTSEKRPLGWDLFEQLKNVAQKGAKDLFIALDACAVARSSHAGSNHHHQDNHDETSQAPKPPRVAHVRPLPKRNNESRPANDQKKTPLFSLANRLQELQSS